MTPIINPWIFYLAEVCDGIKIIAIFTTLVIGIGLLIAHPVVWGAKREEDFQIFYKKSKKFVVTFFISLFLAIFVPFDRTIYKMMVASCVTENNITKGEEEAKELINYIVDKINEVNKNNGEGK